MEIYFVLGVLLGLIAGFSLAALLFALLFARDMTDEFIHLSPRPSNLHTEQLL
jgi:hypothetical protein